MDLGWVYNVFSIWIGILFMFVVSLKIYFGEVFRFKRGNFCYLGLN